MKDNVRNKVLLPLTTTFLVLISVFLLSGYEILENNSLNGLNQKQQQVSRLLDELQIARAHLLAAVIDIISQDQALKNSIRSRDPATATAIVSPFFAFVSKGHGISLLSFYTPDGAPFLGFSGHGHGSALASHYTLDAARRSIKDMHGVELGPDGTLIFRVVVPWYDRDDLIGYIELGGGFRQILEQAKKISQAQFLMTLDQRIYRETFGETSGWGFPDLPNRVPLVNVSELDAFTLFPLLFTADFSEREFQQKNIEIGTNSYRVSLLPFFDSGKRKIGHLITLLEYTDAKTSFYRFFLIIVGGGCLLCLVFFLFAFYRLGELDQELITAQKKLRLEVDNVNSSNAQLEKEIYERRRAENELKALNENLEQHVQERTQRLERLNLEIESNRLELDKAYHDLKAKQATILHQDKMASVGILAAGVAHDINNPLGFVFNNLEALKKYAGRIREYLDLQSGHLQDLADGELLQQLEAFRAEKKLEFIQEDTDILIAESLDGIERIRTIVNNLRSFSRIDDKEKKSVNLEECLESTITIARNEMRDKVEIVRDYGHLPATKCYPQQLNQVFMNLLINAAQAIEKQGTITIRTWQEDRAACVSIADTGIGIPQPHLAKIFDPFFTTKEVGQGTGLGLSIAYDIIKKHQGHLTVDSQEGRGTVFLIKLPLSA